LSSTQLIKNSNIRYSFYIFLGQIIFVLCNLYINYWINKNWDLEAFAIYNLIKRISSFITFPLLMGVGIGIPRYISFMRREVKSYSLEYLIAGGFLFLISFLAFSAIVILFPAIILKAFDQSSLNTENILLCILFFVLSQGLYILLNSYYRGRIQFGIVSSLSVLIMSVIPLSILFWVDNIFIYFYYYSLSTVAIIISIVCYLLRNTELSGNRIQLKARQLFKYGYPRIIADIGLFSLEFMPIFLTSLYIGLPESGFLSMIFILLKLASMLYELVGSMSLPYFGKIYKTESSSVFISKVNSLLVVGISFSVIISTVLYFLIPPLIVQFFPSLSKAIFPAQLIFFAFPVFVVYLLLRNVLDIVLEKAYNSINLSIVFVIQLLILSVGFYSGNFMIYTVLPVIIPYFILGLLTYLVWIKMKKNLRYE
jgi:O-antigen/teichoic acid export membrane protein